MNFSKVVVSGAACVCVLPVSIAAELAVQTLDPLVVTGEGVTESWSFTGKVVGTEVLTNPDAAEMARRMPGAAVARNGSQTGILQLRGLTGDRVNVRVNGMTITPACPNHMDPPLHYAKPAAGDVMALYAGISPVSEGGDAIGGSLSVRRPEPVFADEGQSLLSGELGVSFSGNQDAVSGMAEVTWAAGDGSFSYRGSGTTADDLRVPGGRAAATGFDTTHHEFFGAWRTDGGFVEVDGGYSHTRDAGTPALPMDMVRDESWNFGFRQVEAMAWGTVESRLYFHDTEHLMDNYSVREQTAAMRMESPTGSRDYGVKSEVLLPRGDADVRIGIDLHRVEFEAEQVAVDSGMRRDTFNDNRRHRAGMYVDWENDWNERWDSRIGLRGQMVSTDAKAVDNEILPAAMSAMLMMDQAAFNAADRSFTDAWVDAVAAIGFEPDETSRIELALAVKSRAPSLVERYLWTPLNASAGLADGRTYLGNLDLDPETSFQVSLGVEKRGERWFAEVTPFYQVVDDYIQGEAIDRYDSNGNAVLQFQNVGRADLYGVEFAGGWDFHERMGVETVVSHVRGKNKDTGDDLYRIAPLRGTVDLYYRDRSWESHLEFVWAARQDKVSEAQGETATAGYGLVNFRLARNFADKLRWEAGVENVFDKEYSDHLSGVNRVTGGDVAVGERITGAGRFFYTSVNWMF